MIMAELLKTATCKYSERATSDFRQVVYFLMNVKSQAASLDVLQEPSPQKSNKYCDAMDSESNLGGRGKVTFSGAQYRQTNNNKFRMEVIVLYLPGRPGQSAAALQAGRKGARRGSNPPCNRQQLRQLLCLITALVNCPRATLQPKIYEE